MSDIKLIKLTSGEEILAKVVSQSECAWVLDDVTSVVMHPTKDGTMSVGFAPFMPYNEGTISLWATSIALVAEPNQQLKSEHTRIFSGIEIAPAGSIIT